MNRYDKHVTCSLLILDVKVESALDYKINISMPFFNFTFLLEISTVVNAFRFLSIENVTLGEISDSIKAQHSSPTPKIYTGVNDNINGRVILDFGSIKVSKKIIIRFFKLIKCNQVVSHTFFVKKKTVAKFIMICCLKQYAFRAPFTV